jgi:hypothetical protein
MVATRRPAIADGTSVERGAYIRVRLRDVAEAASLVRQALEDRGVQVLASASPAGMSGSPELAVLTAPVAAEIIERATETLDSLAVVDQVSTVMDCLGPG